MTTYKIHPSIGIARLGNSDDFYLSPEQPGKLPIECDHEGKEIIENGKPKPISTFKDPNDLSKVKRQAARFRVFHYNDEHDTAGEEITLGGEYEFILQTNVTALRKVKGTVTDITWTVHLANKKSSWYEFEETRGMHGYSADHKLRNASVDQPDLRRQLITDPGPLSVSLEHKHAEFTKGKNPGYPQTFPPMDIKPQTIETLGEIMVHKQNKHQRLIVLGGRGNSGSIGTPVITDFVNNDGWFDDISDGPVTATITYQYTDITYDGDKEVKTQKTSTMDVQVPAWVVVGYPRYVPEMADMITLDEAMYDLFVRTKAYDPHVYGVPPYDKQSNSPSNDEEFTLWKAKADFNPDYYPKFFKEIWPILSRPDDYKYTYDFDYFGGGDPHNKGTGGNLDKNALSTPPKLGIDENLHSRQFVYSIMRQPNQLNEYYNQPNPSKNKRSNTYNDSANKPRLMPMLCGNNPLTNVAPQKFLAMTDTQLFFLKQWADGKFVNECDEWNEADKQCQNPWAEPPTTGPEIDRGVLSNLLGGAFCPGGELNWIIKNPSIYSAPYRIKHTTYLAGALSLPKPIADKDGSPAANLAAGLEPGDLTKYIGIPWQADFHECTYQNINITYEDWNNIYLDSTGDPAQENITYNIPWWPAHRPVVVQELNAKGNPQQVYWASGIPPNNAGDLQMVNAWKDLGFLTRTAQNGYVQNERNNVALGQSVKPGNLTLGQSTNATTESSRNKANPKNPDNATGRQTDRIKRSKTHDEYNRK